MNLYVLLHTSKNFTILKFLQLLALLRYCVVTEATGYYCIIIPEADCAIQFHININITCNALSMYINVTSMTYSGKQIT